MCLFRPAVPAGRPITAARARTRRGVVARRICSGHCGIVRAAQRGRCSGSITQPEALFTVGRRATPDWALVILASHPLERAASLSESTVTVTGVLTRA